ncbi:MAG TPA: RNA polymerase factor sigma-54 [Candidatus Binatia bacterium]|nr:RNA polymerase factor sigma-54 [Candidatus Binatia bacterium]
MKQSLHLRVGQTLAMTPALQQAIKLLQLSSLDLQQEIRQAVESNVMLEFTEEELAGPSIEEQAAGEPTEPPATDGAAEAPVEDAIPDELPVDIEWDETYESVGTRSAADEEELYDYRQANLHSGTSLHEHLLWQAGLATFEGSEGEIAANLIDAINDEGYLEDWAGLGARLKESLNCDDACLERVLRKVQDFDPPGVGARDLSECLCLQIVQWPKDTPEREPALKLVREHMALLAKHDEAGMQQALGLDTEALKGVLAMIQSLQPHPGRPYQQHESNYVAPDVFVTKRQGRWRVTLNPDIAPKVRLNQQYVQMVRRADQSKDQQTLKQHLQEARYFLSSLESRNDTLLRVAQCIVEEQRAFLEYGDEAMRPLVLRDIADRLGIHESTVSRATANKYMLTPRGLYELKYFFSSHVTTVQGGTCSATAIQAMIKRMVAAEPADQPLSDSSIADLLLKDGIQVARRTVAKYREGLGIPPSHERRAFP